MYSFEEVFKSSKELFNGDELAADVYTNKYAMRNKNDELVELNSNDTIRRISKEFARVEAKKFKKPYTEEEIFERIKDFARIIPQGSPIFAIGNTHQIVSTSNCFVVPSPEDSYGGILKTDQQIVQISKRRGGIGYDISTLRPKNQLVTNSARTTSGAVSFMHRFSNTGREVGQGGRRAAQMISSGVHHPDILDFIKVKSDGISVTGANISVRLSDEFLKAVKNNQEYELRFPVDSDSPLVSEMIDANKVWKEIIHHAWLRAEPGILFWDNIINNSPADCYKAFGYKTLSTNPCLTGDSYLLTEDGYIRFDHAVDKLIIVLQDSRIVNDGTENSTNWQIANSGNVITRETSGSFVTGYNKEILEIITNCGFKIKCTKNHEIATNRGMVEAKNLSLEDKILVSQPTPINSIINKEPETEEEMLSFLCGLITGDGTFSHSKQCRVHIDLWGEEKEVMAQKVRNMIDKLYDSIGEIKNSKNRTLSRYFTIDVVQSDKIRISSPWLFYVLKNKLNYSFDNKFVVPEAIINNARNNIGKYYISGLMYADGCPQGTKDSGYSVRLNQSNIELLRQVQLMLHANGILTKIYKRRDGANRLLPDGKGGKKAYYCKTNYELITINNSAKIYKDFIGFFNSYKDVKLSTFDFSNRINENYLDEIVEINKIENDDVYCIKEDIGKTIIVNGLSVKRCGEIPLSAYDSCRLMAINLFFYVKNPFTKDAHFDFELFKEDARFAQRLMDDLIDLELEKIEAIIAKIESDPEEESTKIVELELWQNIHKYCKLGRRTGLGITALGDTIAALGLKYGSDESIGCVDSIYSNLKIEAYRSSIDMAEELGPFEIFDYELEKNCPFIKGLPADLLERMSKVGRRNIAILTTAPTGTISILAKIGPYCNTTSGIEPLFMTHYTRRKKINHGDDKSKVDFVDALGDKWSEYTVYHSGVKLWMDITGETDITKSPYYGACSPDIVWTQRVKLQSTAQKHVDHAISSTVNLPNDVSEEEVSKIYTTAWESGCKGMTVYRDGCRSGVLVTNSDKKDTGIVKTQAPKRPKEIDGDVHHMTVGGESYVVIVGLLNGEPYEIFANKNDVIEKTVKKCKIIKLKNKLYKAVFDDESELSPVTTNATEHEEVITRLSSISLRHGADIQFVVEQLLKLKGSMNSFAKSIARALKKYIKDGTKVKESCKECGAELIYEEGCMKCKSCGWTKCS